MEYPQIYVSISMLFLFIIVGLPLWWNTTKVYRATLPINEINMLRNSSFKLKVHIKIYSNVNNLNFSNIQVDESLQLNFTNILTDSSDYSSCCKTMGKEIGNIFTVSFCLLQMQDEFVKICPNSLNSVIGMKHMSASLSIEATIEKLLIMYLPSSSKLLSSNSRTKNSQLPLSPGYRINFVLAVSNPEESMEEWVPSNAVNVFKNYLKNFEFLGPFHFSSQILYYPSMKQEPRKHNNISYYTKAKLAQLINPLESRLNTYTNSDKALQFVIYIPPKEQLPLYIRRKNQNSDPEWLYDKVSFHSPRWGGVYIYNPISTNRNIELPTNDILEIFLNQFNELVGVNMDDFKGSIDNFHSTFLMPYKKLEIAYLFEHLYTSIATLHSLLKLLNEIPNIVIHDEIANLIEQSVHHIEQAQTKMNFGLLSEAFIHAKESYILSEKAFFDSSLLGLLYFPDDQKYAIYVPLFLPISIPVLLSCFKAFKILKTKWKSDKTKTD